MVDTFIALILSHLPSHRFRPGKRAQHARTPRRGKANKERWNRPIHSFHKHTHPSIQLLKDSGGSGVNPSIMSHSYQQQQYPFDSRAGSQGNYYAVEGAGDSRAHLNSAGFAYPPTEKNYPTSSNKMPVYKKWWFWLIIVVAIAGRSSLVPLYFRRV